MDIVCFLLGLYLVAIFVRVVLSWFPMDPNGPLATVGGFFHLITDPVMLPLRKVLPPVRMGTMALDLSPIVVILVLSVVQRQVC